MPLRLCKPLVLAVVVAGGVWITWPCSPVNGDPPTNLDTPLGLNLSLQWQGTASCASTACHNGNGPPGSKGSEYTTWVSDDKHARAYEVLFNKRSQQIARNLGIKHAEKEDLCLKCHAMNPPPSQRHERFVTLADGVSCESCHGPAEKWLARHYLPEWQRKSDEEKESLGMRRTQDLAVRARLCADCHVGKAGQDVDHDLIAAGHPRLHFEYGTYLATMPRHWDEKKDKGRYRDFEARVWAVGQVVSAQTALELLAHRAERAAANKKPWPEFAEYDCFACHHGLEEPNKRPARGFGGGKAGAFPWATWYYALLPQAAGRDAKEFAALNDLKALMAKPYPDPKAVGKKASEAADQLRKLPTPARESPEALHSLLRSLAGDERSDWDSTAQQYLGLAATYQALGDLDARQRDPRLKASLEGMRRSLQFRKGLDSPRSFDPGPVRERLKGIQQQLEP